MLLPSSVKYQSLSKFLLNSFRPCLENISHSPNPSASSSRHRILPTFRHHAYSNAPSPASTVQIGTSYEYLCAHTLPRLGFAKLTRTGGRSDRGIDLLGHLLLPSLSPTSGGIPAIIQCKATARKPGPEMIRELQGALAGAPGQWRDDTTIGVLCAKREATDGVRQAVKRSGRGIMWVMVEDLDEGRGGRVKQVLWNERVGKVVGERVGTGLRYLLGERRMDKEVCITFDGGIWEPDTTIQESRVATQ